MRVANNQTVKTKWRDSIKQEEPTLAGYGYPYIVEDVPPLVRIEGKIDCDLWNEVRSDSLGIYTESHKGLDKDIASQSEQPWKNC